MNMGIVYICDDCGESGVMTHCASCFNKHEKDFKKVEVMEEQVKILRKCVRRNIEYLRCVCEEDDYCPRCNGEYTLVVADDAIIKYEKVTGKE